ncbi:hypothetical protein BG003_008045 [Podila horticola]|nr:hypothetical protein BG003_008045 [Podila horticola]
MTSEYSEPSTLPSKSELTTEWVPTPEATPDVQNMLLGERYTHIRDLGQGTYGKVIETWDSLISNEDYLKLADFGAAKIDQAWRSGRTYVGEVAMGQPYGKEADMFSAGGVLFHLCTMREPQEGENLVADENNLPGEFKTLIGRLRSGQPGERPRASDLVHGEPGVLRYRLDDLDAAWKRHASGLQVELKQKGNQIEDLESQNRDFTQVVENLRTEIEGKDTRIEELELTSGSPVYHPLNFDRCQTFEDLDQVRAAWRIGMFLGRRGGQIGSTVDD